jgi:hypothetical protein
VEPLEVIEKVVRAPYEHRLFAPQVEHYRSCSMSCLTDHLLPESIVIIEIEIGEGQLFGFEDPEGK